MQYGNIILSFFGNGIEFMGMGICQDSDATILVAVGG